MGDDEAHDVIGFAVPAEEEVTLFLAEGTGADIRLRVIFAVARAGVGELLNRAGGDIGLQVICHGGTPPDAPSGMPAGALVGLWRSFVTCPNRRGCQASQSNDRDTFVPSPF